ncbi:MAG: hypothetical protein J5986_08830, partial [Roseburia sp.]|nr:hypothetical protein [Roseburia sp.]
MVYTVQNQCIEDTHVRYEDGAKKIFLPTKGVKGNPSQEFRDMLKYIEETTADNLTTPAIAAVRLSLRQNANTPQEDFQHEQLRRTIFSGGFYPGIHS